MARAGYLPGLLISPEEFVCFPGPTPTPQNHSSFLNEDPLLEFQRNTRGALKHIREKLDMDQSQSYGL